MTRYTAHGKQVLRGSEHVADAADETWAQIITDALNGERSPQHPMEQIIPDDPHSYVAVDIDAVREYRGGAWNDAKVRLMGFDGPEHVVKPELFGADYASEPDKTVHMQVDGVHRQPSHIWQRQQDEYACSCGARWDVSDGDEHPPTR